MLSVWSKVVLGRTLMIGGVVDHQGCCIYTYNGNPQLTILGNAEGTSSLSQADGIRGHGGAITTNDDDFDVTREGDLPDRWHQFGRASSARWRDTSKSQFSNSVSAGKTLNVTIDERPILSNRLVLKCGHGW